MGIDGPGGAGKSVLAAALARKDARISVVPIDDFYVPRADRVRGRDALLTPWENLEVSRVQEEVLQPLAAGIDCSYRRYDWGSDALAERRVIPSGGIVLVEGVYALIPPLRDYYHLTVWMDCPRELRLERGLARDGQQALAQWKDQWMPAEDRYAATQLPMDGADLLLDWKRTEGGDPTLVLKGKSGRNETQESWRVTGHVARGHLPALRPTGGARPDGASDACCQATPRSAPGLHQDGRRGVGP